MSHRSSLDAIDPNSYGQKHADNLDALINQIFTSTDSAAITKGIEIINQIHRKDLRDEFMDALIEYWTTGNRDASVKQIKDHEWFVSQLPLGKYLHALRVRQDKTKDSLAKRLQSIRYLHALRVRLFKVKANYLNIQRQGDQNYQPAATSITENLYETIQASNAPSTAKERSSLQSLSS